MLPERSFAMNEVKKPERPIIFYYIVTLALLVAFNHLFMPYFESQKIKSCLTLSPRR